MDFRTFEREVDGLSYKKIAVLAGVVILIVCGCLVYWRDHVLVEKRDIPALTDVSAAYQADEEIAAAKSKLEEGIAPAEVITTLPVGGNCVAIVIDGLPDRSLAARMADVLQKHHATATFFVEGQNAADETETIRLLCDAGFELGNYTFVGLARLDQVSQDEQLEEICRTQKILLVRSAFTPTLFRAPRTVFSDALLQAVHAAGIPYVVKENVRVPRHVLVDEEAADAYAAGIADGSIIAIPANRPVERKADTEGKIDERPAIDMKPTIQDAGEQAPVATEDLASELDRLLTALEKRGFKVMNVNGFRKIHYIPANAVVVGGQAASMAAGAVSENMEDEMQGGGAGGQ